MIGIAFVVARSTVAADSKPDKEPTEFALPKPMADLKAARLADVTL